jgi:hypothetical protein
VSFTRKPIAIGTAVTFGLAVALAFVVTNGDRSSLAKRPPFADKLSAQEIAGNRGEPGEDSKGGENPIGAEEQNYLEHAYPASEVRFQATLNALQSWKQLKGKKGKNTVGQWTLAGPSTANYPGVLSFSGADYTASGRVTGLAIDPDCSQSGCRVWMAAAGGGVWRTDNALSGSGATWKFLSDSFGTNAIGTLVYDQGVLYAGTGESHASGDSEAGLGIWKSTDGGDSWTKLASQVTNLNTSSCGASNSSGACVLPVANGNYTGDAFAGRSISSIVVDPNDVNTLYVSSTRGVRGVSSVTGGATTNPPTPRPPFGLFKSTDGGATFSFIWDGNVSLRGVNRVMLDPSNASIVYAAAYQQGVWRSFNGGTTFAQILTPVTAADNTDRAELAVTELPNGNTRMYVGDGGQGFAPAQFFRTDDASGAASFTNNTTSQNSNYCTGQCWYDNVVYSPPGKPDVVYLGGSYDYGTYGRSTNGRAFLYSTDAGATFTDMTWDASSATAPNGMHPDSHAVVEIPGTNAAIFGCDGGVTRTSGAFANVSSQCASRGLSGANLTLCQQLLSRVPTYLYSMNKKLSTLQFQSLSVAADDPKHLQGGTQDNGTFETTGSAVVWPQIIYGDGGQSGFSSGNSALRFNSFFGQFHDANFQNGDPTKWVIISGKIVSSPEGSNFYAPIIADPNPANAGTIFQGSQSVWRTQDWGGDQAFLEANCPEFTTSGANPNCGDFERIGPAGATDLTAAALGTRAGGFVAAVERTPSDTGTLWVATNTGRVFVSKNSDAAAASVTFTRLDTLPSATADPNRFVSGIQVDPNDSNHAWISYSGYNFNTPAQPGHVFSVTYDGTGNATWTDISYNIADLPVTDVVRDSNGDLYASSDFGVMRLVNGSTTWVVAGNGLPQVEVAGLTIASGARKLYAATHGRSAWLLTLP